MTDNYTPEKGIEAAKKALNDWQINGKSSREAARQTKIGQVEGEIAHAELMVVSVGPEDKKRWQSILVYFQAMLKELHTGE